MNDYKPVPAEIDGIPVGDFRDRVCYVPQFGGGYELRDPERLPRPWNPFTSWKQEKAS